MIKIGGCLNKVGHSTLTNIHTDKMHINLLQMTFFQDKGYVMSEQVVQMCKQK